MHLSQMEENSRHFAIINDIVLYNSTYAASATPSFIFLITSQIKNFYLPMTCSSNDGYTETTSDIAIQQIGDSLMIGTCSVVEDPLYVSLKLDDFVMQIDVPTPITPLNLKKLVIQEDHVICMSHLVLYEDGTTILSLLKHFKNSAAKIMIYAASVSDSLYKALKEYSENIEVVPWMLPDSKKRGEFDKLKLDPNYAKAGMESSLTHCFLNYAPVVKKVTLIDLATLKFNSIPFNPDYTISKEVSSLAGDKWRIRKLVNFRVAVNSQNDVVLHEKCFVRQDALDWEKECGDLRNPNAETPSRSTYIPKVIQFDNLSIYEDALGRCTSYKSTIEDRQKLMKFEFELENRVSSEVCEIELMRDDFKCRVAMDYSKKMFRRRTRLLITHKRAFLRFWDGCHL
uniref:Glycosyltransferase family 92 protein n=1 Tax=Caenorhabditis japonica TaxID=281687 RepID=A0A8R1I4U9_CAEJA